MFQYFRLSKNITDKRRGAGITIFPRNFCLSRYQKMPKVTLLCFKKSLVTKNLRIGEWGGEKGPSRLSVKGFCITVTKSFVVETFCISQNFWYRKIV